jgi:crotonobetainyl-CoA hydratase
MTSNQDDRPAESPAGGEESYEQLLDDYSHLAPPVEGEVLMGHVLQVTAKGVIVDVGLKQEGFVPLDQVSSPDGQLLVQPGDTIEVTIDRPKANAIDAATSRIMGDVFAKFRDDPELRVAILTATGEKFFCPGWDLKAAAAGEAPDVDYGVGGFGGLQELKGLNKPVICAVNGLAFGGGFEIMLACDLAIAVETAEFSLPEVLVGAGAFGGGIPRLCRKMPYALALELVLTGRRLSANDALRFGLLNQVVPPGQALAAAKELALDIMRGAPLASEASKQVADMALHGLPLSQILAEEDGEPKQRVMRSADLQEGIQAFFGKRTPRWQGR